MILERDAKSGQPGRVVRTRAHGWSVYWDGGFAWAKCNQCKDLWGVFIIVHWNEWKT